MNKITSFLSNLLLVIMSLIIFNPIVAKAEELAEAEQTEEIGPITAFIALVVLVVVAYFVYHLLYDNTVIFGTRQGVNYALGRRLAIPVLCGGGAAWLVVKILNFLSGILTILIIVAAVICVIFLIYKFVSKKNPKSDDITDDVNAVSSTEKPMDEHSVKTQDKESNIKESISKSPIVEDTPANNISNELDKKSDLKTIMSKINIHESDCESGLPITEGELLEKARQYFEIPITENVYLIFDTTIRGNCKNGFAICETGIYSRLQQQRYMTWAELKTKQITVGNYLCIGGDEFNIGRKKMKNKLYELLCELQNSLE